MGGLLTTFFSVRFLPTARNENQYIEAYLQKISFSHEESSDSSSTQTFSVQSYEVRDRLDTSSMNKLLHLYTTRASRRQAQREMLELCVASKRSEIDPDVTDMRCVVLPEYAEVIVHCITGVFHFFLPSSAST